MDYQGSGGYDNSGGGPSPSQPKGKRNYDERSITPVTVAMAQSASSSSGEDGALVLPDGRKLNQICLVGATRTVDDFSTNVLYNIEDGTGLIEVKQWLDDNESSVLSEIRQKALKEHVYLKIVGTIREYDEKKTVVADSVRCISSGNELTHHMLSVIYSAESFKRKSSFGISSGMGGVGFGAGPVPARPGQSFSPMDMGNSGGGGAGALQNVVLDFIKTHGEETEAGANLQQCIQSLTMAGHSEGAIRKAIDDLNNEGHIYSTIDDNNFKAAM
jgi:replication factor A2